MAEDKKKTTEEEEGKKAKKAEGAKAGEGTKKAPSAPKKQTSGGKKPGAAGAGEEAKSSNAKEKKPGAEKAKAENTPAKGAGAGKKEPKAEKESEKKEPGREDKEKGKKTGEKGSKSKEKKSGERSRRRRNSRRRSYREEWVPKTEVGKKVMAGEITDIDEILKEGRQIMEAGIVDTLLPGLQEEVIDFRRVQRTLDSGRRMRFSIMVVVGDKNGHVGVGAAKGSEIGPTIRKAIVRGKLNIIRVPRSCSSWECGCGEPHTFPFRVTGKNGSVTVVLKPAPRGVGLVAGDNSKIVLNLAGIKDAWMFTKGHSRTVINQVLAIYEALEKLSGFKETAKFVGRK